MGMIVAIIRGFEPDVCLRLAEAYVKGGIWMVEVYGGGSDGYGNGGAYHGQLKHEEVVERQKKSKK